MANFRHLLYAGALALTTLATPALAVDNNFDLGTIPEGSLVATQSPHPERGTFTDTFTFNLAVGGGDGAYTYFEFDSPLSEIVDAMLTIAGPTSIMRNLTDGYAETLFLAAGSYTATITGNASGLTGGSYALGITAPSPEPEIWLSLIAGAGLAGVMARRRRKQQAIAA